jgi:hypothetical protein
MNGNLNGAAEFRRSGLVFGCALKFTSVDWLKKGNGSLFGTREGRGVQKRQNWQFWERKPYFFRFAHLK